MLCDRMGIDVWEVADAAATKPFGFMRFTPGPGLGGHCIPLDPFYLSWRARQFDFHTEFIELAGKVNQNMPYFCREKVGRALNGQSKPLRGSAGARRRRGLQARHRRHARVAGAEADRAAARRGLRGQLPRPVRRRSCASSAWRPSRWIRPSTSSDCVVVVTNHSSIDYADVVARAQARRRLPQRHRPGRHVRTARSSSCERPHRRRRPGLLGAERRAQHVAGRRPGLVLRPLGREPRALRAAVPAGALHRRFRRPAERSGARLRSPWPRASRRITRSA